MKCVICGKEIERVKPCEYYRRRGEATCDECCERCYESEPFPCHDHDARVRAAEPITYYRADGTITARGGYDAAIKKLCALEDRYTPLERYTFHIVGTGEPCPRRGIELIMCRLYEYEHGRF